MFLQRTAHQLKAQRQLEEALESRLQRMQTNMQTVTQVPSDATLSTDTNISTGELLRTQVLCQAVFSLFNDLWPQFND